VPRRLNVLLLECSLAQARSTLGTKIKMKTKGTWRFRASVHDENGVTWGSTSAHMHVRWHSTT